jgi:uncharacterized protein (DUF2236 family)
MLLKARSELATRCGHCRVPGQHHEIDSRQCGSPQAETLPHQPPQSVAPDSEADFLFGDSEAQARPIQAVLVEQNSEKAIRGPLAVLEHIIELCPVEQAQLPREGLLVLARRLSGLRGDRDVP